MTLLADGGFPDTWWTALLTPGVLLTGAAVLLALAVILAVLLWWGTRRLRRSGVLQRSMLNARAGLGSGVDRDIAGLRLQLRASVDSAAAVAARTDPASPAAAEMSAVLGRLQRSAAAVDADLRDLQRAPDTGPERRDAVALHGAEVDELTLAAARIRDAFSRTAVSQRATELRAVSAQVEEQVGNLDAYRKAYRELGG